MLEADPACFGVDVEDGWWRSAGIKSGGFGGVEDEDDSGAESSVPDLVA